MASEYLKKKYKDVKPDVKRELTPEEKRKNWWDYHKWHVVIGVVLLLLAADLVWNMFGRNEPEPDVQIAYIGAERLPDSTTAAMETAFAGLTEDLNGDGQVLVSVRQFVSSPIEPASVTAVQVQLMADIMECESYLFLLDDPAGFQLSNHILCRLDGSLPEIDDNTVEDVALLWKDCPVLAELELGEYEIFGSDLTGKSQDLLAPLYIARRGYWSEADAKYYDSYTAMWNRLVVGAEM